MRVSKGEPEDVRGARLLFACVGQRITRRALARIRALTRGNCLGRFALCSNACEKYPALEIPEWYYQLETEPPRRDPGVFPGRGW